MKKTFGIIIISTLLLISVSAILFVNYNERRKQLISEIVDLKSQVTEIHEQISIQTKTIDTYNDEKKPLESELTDLEEAIQTPKLISHKGYNLVAPENNILAFSAALDNGFNELETDIQFTKDNIPVLSHDDTINKIAYNSDGSSISSRLRISELTLEELYQFDFGIYKGQEFAGTKISTFEGLLKLASEDKRLEFLHIELKAPFTYYQKEVLVNLVKKYGLESKVSWVSFRWSDFDDFELLAPSMQLEFLSATFNDDMLSALKRFDNGQRKVIASFSYGAKNLLDSLNYGYEVYIWTVNDENIMSRFKDVNISAIATDGSRDIENVIKGESFEKINSLKEQISKIQSEIDKEEKLLSEAQKNSKLLSDELNEKEEELENLTILNWVVLLPSKCCNSVT